MVASKPAKRASTAEISARILEIRVIEGIECLNSQLDIAALMVGEDHEVLGKLQVGVVEAGAVEEVPLHIAVGSNRLVGKRGRVEEEVAGC